MVMYNQPEVCDKYIRKVRKILDSVDEGLRKEVFMKAVGEYYSRKVSL